MKKFKFMSYLLLTSAIFLNHSCTQKNDYSYFSSLSCKEKVEFIKKYNDDMAKKSWYAEGDFQGMVSKLSLKPIDLKFKAYITPKKTEIEIIPEKFINLKTKIIDTKKDLSICLYFMGAYKCSTLGEKNFFSNILNSNYWSYNTLTGIFPFEMNDVKKFSCNKDNVDIQIDDIKLKYKFVKLQEVSINKHVKTDKLDVDYSYSLKYEYKGNKIKKADFKIKFGDLERTLYLDYKKFEELKEKKERSP